MHFNSFYNPGRTMLQRHLVNKTGEAAQLLPELEWWLEADDY